MKKLFRLVMFTCGITAAVAVALWLLRERISGPALEPVRSHDEAPRIRPEPEPAGDTSAAPAPVTAAAPDDLTVVSGIGPVYRDRLATAGITTFAALAAADISAVAEAVDRPTSYVEDWIGQAASLA